MRSFPIDCEFSDGTGWSIFQPSSSQSTSYTATPQEGDGCEEPGCYEDIISYRFNFANNKHFILVQQRSRPNRSDNFSINRLRATDSAKLYSKSNNRI